MVMGSLLKVLFFSWFSVLPEQSLGDVNNILKNIYLWFLPVFRFNCFVLQDSSKLLQQVD